MGKVIHWELCKELKFEYTNKWYMYNPETVLENETHKLIWDFEIQTDHLTLKWTIPSFFWWGGTFLLRINVLDKKIKLQSHCLEDC